MKTLKTTLITLVLIFGLKTAFAQSTTVICDGQSKTLSASASAAQYQWFNNGTLDPTLTTQSVTISRSGVYTVVLISDKGCASDASAPATINVAPAIPVPTIALSGNAEFCVSQGGPLTLTASNPPSANVPDGVTYIYKWFKDDVQIASQSGNTLTVSQVSESGNYQVSITTVWNNQELCSEISTKTLITIDPLPEVPTIQVTGGGGTLHQTGNAVDFCQRQTITLTATTTTAGVTYAWFKDGDATVLGTSATLTLTDADAGTYYVTVKTDKSCTTSSDKVIVTIDPLPATPTIIVN